MIALYVRRRRRRNGIIDCDNTADKQSVKSMTEGLYYILYVQLNKCEGKIYVNKKVAAKHIWDENSPIWI